MFDIFLSCLFVADYGTMLDKADPTKYAQSIFERGRDGRVSLALSGEVSPEGCYCV